MYLMAMGYIQYLQQNFKAMYLYLDNTLPQQKQNTYNLYNSYKKCIKRYLKVYSSFEHNVVLNIFAGDNLWNRKSIIQKIAHIAFDQRNECHNQLILKLKVHEHLGCFLKIKLRSRFHLIKAPCILDNYNKSNHHIKS